MFLQEVFDQLTYGELSQTNIGGSSVGEIISSNYPAMVAHTNMGLTRLHNRFSLQTGEVIIQQYEGVTIYYLEKRFTVSAGTEPIKYIEDGFGTPFKENVIKIEEVFDELGNKYPLNDSNDEYSLFTPAYDRLQIPFPNATIAMSVMYRANHEKLSAIGLDPETTELHIPYTLLEPLVYFIASRIFASRQTTEFGNESANWYGRYEAACRTLELYGVDNTDATSAVVFEQGGWV